MEEIKDSLEGNKEIFVVTMLSHPNPFVSICTNTPTSAGLHDDPAMKVESCAEKETVVMTRLSHAFTVEKCISVTPRLEESQEVLKIKVVSGIPAVIVVMTRLSQPI